MKYNPYSFSKISTFSCPMKFKLNYIDKIRVKTSNIALEKGSYIHQMLEDYSKSVEDSNFEFRLSTPEQIREYQEIFQNFVDSPEGHKYLDPEPFGVELEFALKIEDKKLVPTNYHNKQALIRGKIDHAIRPSVNRMILLDWKTGKVKDVPDVLQVLVYAVWCFYNFPEVDVVDTAFVYVEHSQSKEYTFTRANLKKFEEKMLQKIIEIELAKEFPKRETALCNWCDYRKQGICTETNNADFNNDMMKYSMNFGIQYSERGLGREKFHYVHQESGCCWTSYKDDEMVGGDGCVEPCSYEQLQEFIRAEYTYDDFTIPGNERKDYDD